ncbi:hypothetical protein ROJ8625_03630 [Roseivivax jejudonensis]|uniref:Uncharacterized protein n=1 Tax=Roseivivax jejudonensis TaxID=1529041 RepID=A0A1X7A3M9_9RHOB|nr:hypothetical protein [Roseivivax jejudonensis]SLN69719.1 hypothetical protein ROJ8625_03630 [Roseivivax jejudonensis]
MTTRALIAGLALAGLATMTLADLAATGGPDIYRQPPLIALGSGAAAGGAHCAALPQ